MIRGRHSIRARAGTGRRLNVASQLPRVRRGLANFYRGFSYGAALLRDPLPPDTASAIRTRLARRTDLFLATVEQSIFAHAGSPYRPLLDAAGYDLVRIKTLVGREGVEGTLGRLVRDGVYVAIEEFKGIREARRGDRTFRFDEKDFRNPYEQPGVRVSSGGTRSHGILTSLAVSDRRINAEHRAWVSAAYGIEDAPVAIWFAAAASGLRSVLSLAVMRRPPARWFVQIPGPVASAGESAVHYLGMKAAARLFRVALPRPAYVPFGQESRILQWITREVCGRCSIWTTASAALRLALVARRTNTALSNATFVVGSEPLTPTKQAALHAVGARVISCFSFTELGRAAWGCAVPASPDDMHICRDTVAVIQRRRAVDRIGSEVDALLFTALRPDARRILLNMESGDYGRMSARRCGCPLEAVGWLDHIEEVRSFEKLNPEGWCFSGSRLITLVEETLPDRFGGGPTDYQLLEHEDEDGATRVSVLVHPRLGAIDEAGVLRCVEETLVPSTGWDWIGMYRHFHTLRVQRKAPMMTRAGKLMPLHHLGQTASPERPGESAVVSGDRPAHLA